MILYGQAEDVIISTDITNNKYITYYKRGTLIRPGLLWFPKSCKEFPAQISKSQGFSPSVAGLRPSP